MTPISKNLILINSLIGLLSATRISWWLWAVYEIFVEAAEFRGLDSVKQHRLIKETLKAQIVEMHGLRIHTAVAQ
jgi:BolA-like protein 3